MPLAPGARLGSYDILSPLGAGGMGAVYRARDTKLGREVAIKILPDQFATDPDRRARFQREAHVLASLNHPHIAQIYGLEDADGGTALVMELVEGEDLSQRIARGAIPLEEALLIAKQIAETASRDDPLRVDAVISNRGVLPLVNIESTLTGVRVNGRSVLRPRFTAPRAVRPVFPLRPRPLAREPVHVRCR